MSTKHTCLKHLFIIVHFYFRLVGLRPYDYDYKTFQIKNSKLNTIWAILINVVIIHYYLQSINLYIVLLEDTFRQSFISAISTKYIFYSNIIVFTLIYVFQILFKFKIILILTKVQKFIKKTPTDDKLNYSNDLFIFLFKAVFSKVSLFGAALLNVQTNIGTYFNAIMIVIPIIVIYSVSSLFYGMSVGAKYYFKSINNKIEMILYKINDQKTWKSTSYEKIKIHCDLSDQIDEIARMHGELCDLTKEFMHLYQIQVLLTFVNIFTSLLAQVLKINLSENHFFKNIYSRLFIAT